MQRRYKNGSVLSAIGNEGISQDKQRRHKNGSVLSAIGNEGIRMAVL